MAGDVPGSRDRTLAPRSGALRAQGRLEAARPGARGRRGRGSRSARPRSRSVRSSGSRSCGRSTSRSGCMDLTTLEGTRHRRARSSRCARRPSARTRSTRRSRRWRPICLYPHLDRRSRSAQLKGIGVQGRERRRRRSRPASGRLGARLAEIREVVDAGRATRSTSSSTASHFLGRPVRAVLRGDRRGRARPAASAHLKVILETGELGHATTTIRQASRAGDGRRRRLHQDLDRQGRRRPRRCPSRSCMLEAVRDFYHATGRARRREGGRRHPDRRSRRSSTSSWCTRRSGRSG